MGKVLTTLLTVIMAVGGSAVIWVSANLAFNQVRTRWERFTAIAYGACGFLLGAVLHGNRITKGSGGGDNLWLNCLLGKDDDIGSRNCPYGEMLSSFFETIGKWIWLPLLFAVAFAVVGVVIGRTTDQTRRLVIGTAFGAAVGVIVGVLVRDEYQPALEVLPLIGWTVAIAAIGGGLSMWRKRPPVRGALVGGAIGWVLGGWGAAELGSGSAAEAIIASVVPGLLIGARLGLTTIPDHAAKATLDQRSRAVIFLGPALMFIFAALVIPTIRTFYLSFLDKDSEEFVRLRNYGDTFSDEKSWNTSNWTDMFTSRLFFIGIALLAISLVIGVTQKRRTGRAVELGNPTVSPLLIGGLLVAFAVFTAVRGTIANNLWWVVTVTFASTSLGLAVAVLADNAKLEKVAKSIIFMPMAISLVGASVIWRFMYVTRDTTQDQTGVLNAMWVGLGRLSTGSGLPTYIVGAVIAALLLVLLVVMARALVRRNYAKAALPGAVVLLLGWFFVRYVGSGVGGFIEREDGTITGKAIGFIQEGPFNNMWLMVILIWIQTGFAMVILSAAIKAVPSEIIEAAHVDGATRSQTFWRVVLPQIATTIGVVVTTLIVLVMKVFDIVKVVTNGNFDTQVLANDMYAQAFQFGDTGRGAALAIILFLSVLPVMVFNIRRMQKEN